MSNDFKIYPNPAKEILHIQTKSRADFSFLDFSDTILFSKTIYDNGSINISEFTSGIYYVKNNATGRTEKVFVEK